MKKIMINGPATLSGSIDISGSKNASLPMMAATLLSSTPTTLTNMPDLVDVKMMKALLESLGVEVQLTSDQSKYSFQLDELSSHVAAYELVSKMRASILVLGPLLGRFGKAKVSLPGGCAIGLRPIDLHLEGLKKMGAQIHLHEGYVEAFAEKLVGAHIDLPFPSVGATENLMMAAVLAEGKTVITGAAKEPEIINLGDYLKSGGAKISGHGTDTIIIEGVSKLSLGEFRVISDRIEAATFLMMAVATNSDILIKNFDTNMIKSVIDVITEMGGRLEIEANAIKVLKRDKLQGVKVKTAPYPGIPTDVQAQLLILTLQCETPSEITEDIFENRFMYVPEIKRMGANIKLKKNVAHIYPGTKLSGAPVKCTDLRASSALIMAGLLACGQTVIKDIIHLERGYEKIENKLHKLGVQIFKV